MIEPEIHNVDAEYSVIGALMLKPDCLHDIADLRAEHFFFGVTGELFQILSEFIAAGRPVDLITVSDEAYRRGMDTRGFDIGLLRHIMDATPSHHNVKRYAEIVQHRAIERQLADAANQIGQIALSTDGRTIAEKQAEASRILSAILDTAAPDSKHEHTTNDAVQRMIALSMERMDRPAGQIGGLPSGLKQVDEVLDGFRGGQLIVIGGRTSMGKSVAAMQIAATASAQGAHGRYFSLEMPAHDLMRRVVASKGLIPLNAIKMGMYREDDYARLTAACSWASDLPILIDTRSSLSHEQVSATCRKHKRKRLDYIVVDHLHLMNTKGENKASALAEVTKAMKGLALELDVPVFLVAQINREAAKGTTKKPALHDLRDSGAIEQDADVVILIHRDGYYDENANQNEAEWNIAKNRDGETRVIRCGWDGSTSRFTDSIPDWTPTERKPTWSDDL